MNLKTHYGRKFFRITSWCRFCSDSKMWKVLLVRKLMELSALCFKCVRILTKMMGWWFICWHFLFILAFDGFLVKMPLEFRPIPKERNNKIKHFWLKNLNILEIGNHQRTKSTMGFAFWSFLQKPLIEFRKTISLKAKMTKEQNP